MSRSKSNSKAGGGGGATGGISREDILQVAKAVADLLRPNFYAIEALVKNCVHAAA